MVAETKVAKNAVSLLGAARRFFEFANPRIIAPVWAAVLVARLAVGRWTWWDAVAAGIVLAIQPFTEWTLHVFLLHFKPKVVLGRRIDPVVSRKHRAHHADPWDEKLRFILMPGLIVLLSLAAVLPWVIASNKPIGLTVALTMTSVLFNYEWIHYLVHSRYVPRTRAYRYVWRSHRLHHFKNEHYWFGVTMHAGDWLLGTAPSKDAVPTSTTVRTLGVEAGV